MEKYIPIIKGLISYHERMTAPMEAVKCEADCPVVIAENDLYLGALKAALVLMEREVKSTVNIELCNLYIIVSVLKDLQTMISNGESFESIVKRWIPVDDDPINAEEALRVAYAQTIGEAISFLQNCS